MNHVILIGRLLHDWHHNKTNNDVSVASNTLVTVEHKSGKEEHHELTAWGLRADQIVDASAKGDTLTIVGKIVTSIWQNKAGTTSQCKKIHVHKFNV